MMSGMIFEQRQILKANVDFSDGTGTKSRPVVIISHNKHNNSSDDLICCPITSDVKGRGQMIFPKDYELESVTLPVPQSEIKSQYPMILHKSRLKPLQTARIKITKELAKKVFDDIQAILEIPK